MRRTLAVGVAVLLTLAGAGGAAAFPAAHVTFSPNAPSTGARVTLDVRGVLTPRHLALRLARGTEVDPRAVGTRCTVGRAADDDCPETSRIGKGVAAVSDDRIPVDIDVYLAPERRPGDIAGVALVARTDDGAGAASGRIFRLDEDTYPMKGIQLTFNALPRAFRQAAGSGRVLRHLNVHLEAHRTLAGERHDLISTPNTCGEDGWPWTVELRGGGGSSFFHGPMACPD